MARKLGFRNASTVQGWLRRGVIPVRRQALVLSAAKVARLDLKAEDLVPYRNGAHRP